MRSMTRRAILRRRLPPTSLYERERFWGQCLELKAHSWNSTAVFTFLSHSSENKPLKDLPKETIYLRAGVGGEGSSALWPPLLPNHSSSSPGFVYTLHCIFSLVLPECRPLDVVFVPEGEPGALGHLFCQPHWALLSLHICSIYHKLANMAEVRRGVMHINKKKVFSSILIINGLAVYEGI